MLESQHYPGCGSFGVFVGGGTSAWPPNALKQQLRSGLQLTFRLKG